MAEEPAPSPTPPGGVPRLVGFEPPLPALPPPRHASRFATEDRIAFGLAAVVLLGAVLSPFYEGPTRDIDLAFAAAVAVLAAAVWAFFFVIPGGRNEDQRRVLGAILGTIIAAAALLLTLDRYLIHQRLQPKLGVVGHLSFVGAGLLIVLVAGAALAWTGVATRRLAPTRRVPEQPYEEKLKPVLRYGVPLLVFVGAFFIYYWDVDSPSIIDFDEAHYVRVATNLTDGNLIDSAWGTDHPRPHNFEHPPVGKYLIAAGYWAYGEEHDELDWGQYYKLCNFDNPVCAEDAESWRMGSVLAGALGVLGMYWLGTRLFRRWFVGGAAAAFLLTDNLYYLHSRIAMLDIFPVAFALLGLGVYLGPGRAHPWIGSALFGLALSSKMSALFFLPPFLLLVFLTSRHTDRWMRLRDALIRGLIVPGAVYLVSYTPYWVHWFRVHGLLGGLEDFIYVHQEGFRWLYRADVPPHPYVSEPQTWVPMRRPVLYFVGYNAAGDVGHIYALGNAFTWISGLVAGVFATLMALSNHLTNRARWGIVAFWQWIGHAFQFRDHSRHLFTALLFASAYVPFFTVQRDQFNFYFLTAAPFLSLVLGGYVGRAVDPSSRLTSRTKDTWLPTLRLLLALVAIVLAVAWFWYYHPVVDGTYMTEAKFQEIMRFLRCPNGIGLEPCMRQ